MLHLNRARTAPALAIAFVAIYGGVYIGAFVTGDKALVHDLTETLKAILLIVVGFYFGSSYGSQVKNALIGQRPANDDAPAPAPESEPDAPAPAAAA